jgi:hypothetical protein
VYKVIGLQIASGAPPVYEEFGDGFLLRQLYFDPEAASPAEKDRLADALEKAIRFVRGS